jgi:hypothetical protein
MVCIGTRGGPSPALTASAVAVRLLRWAAAARRRAHPAARHIATSRRKTTGHWVVLFLRMDLVACWDGLPCSVPTTLAFSG